MQKLDYFGAQYIVLRIDHRPQEGSNRWATIDETPGFSSQMVTSEACSIGSRKAKLSEILPGFQNNPYCWMKHARLLVLSSDYEGIPSVVVEALICGAPVVSTDCPSGPNEIMTVELARWLVPQGNSDLLARKTDEALQSEIDLGVLMRGVSMLRRQHKNILTRFTIILGVRKYDTMWSRLLATLYVLSFVGEVVSRVLFP